MAVAREELGPMLVCLPFALFSFTREQELLAEAKTRQPSPPPSALPLETSLAIAGAKLLTCKSNIQTALNTDHSPVTHGSRT